MKKMAYTLMFLVLLVAGLFLCPAKAQAFVIDGNLNDWGVTPRAFLLNLSDWTPNVGIWHVQEDQITNYLDPGSGGQLFDAEAMYAAVQGQNLYFAVVTGHPAEGVGNLKPGDIAFDFGSNGSYEYGIETVNRGNLKAGRLYSVTQWGHGIWNNYDPTQIEGIDKKLGAGSLAYNNTYYGCALQGSHYVIEGVINTSYFGVDWGKNFTMSWTQTCGNDVIKLDVNPVPEPATMTLFGLGLGGLGLLRRKFA